MEISIRKNHELRLKAFDLISELKPYMPMEDVIDVVYGEFGIPKANLYDWYTGKFCPYGRKEEITYKPELFYVLGAVLGDGYTYSWKVNKREHFRVGLDVKNKIFALKYAQKLSKGTGFKINACYYANKELWFVRLDNKELYLLVNKLRFSPDLIISLINKNDKSLSKAINFIEGFFDADGCVKIVNDSARKIPKICLDFTSTDSNRIEVIRILLENYLGIKARYSNQGAYMSKDGFPRKKAYHLRIYKKEFVKRFLKKIKTIKLYDKKVPYVEKWMNNKWMGGPHPIPK